MKFYLDEDLAPAVALALRQRGIDAVSAHDVRNLGLGDTEQLAFAARYRRCLVTGNARDFRSLGHEAVARQAPHAGIVVCPPKIHAATIGTVVTALIMLSRRYPAGLGDYDVVYLDV